jgi:hypothetical protein
MARIDFDVLWLEQQIAELVRDFPDLEEDEALKADVVEGQIDVEAVMARVVSHIMEADEMLDGMKPRFEDLSERKKRWERRKDFLRSLAQRVLEASGRAKIELPEATVSRQNGRESVEVTDLEALPQGTFTVERKPDKKAIAEQLKAGSDVPGARLVKGDDSVRIGTK